MTPPRGGFDRGQRFNGFFLKASLRENRKRKQARCIKTIVGPVNISEDFNLPKILNLNPRSALNKIDEITTFINEEGIDIAFISDSHDRDNKKLEDNIHIDSHEVISNINQRPSKTSGGRPAIIVNRNKYQIQNLTNTLVTIPWGIEMVWALLTPKSFVNGCIVKHIVLGALYVRPSKPNK